MQTWWDSDKIVHPLWLFPSTISVLPFENRDHGRNEVTVSQPLRTVCLKGSGTPLRSLPLFHIGWQKRNTTLIKGKAHSPSQCKKKVGRNCLRKQTGSPHESWQWEWRDVSALVSNHNYSLPNFTVRRWWSSLMKQSSNHKKIVYLTQGGHWDDHP